MTRPTFVSLLVDDDQGRGHIYPYAKAIEKIVFGLSWDYQCFAPRTATCHMPGARLECAIDSWDNSDASLARRKKLRHWFAFIRSIEKARHKILSQTTGKAIVFVETFSVLKLLGVWMGLLCRGRVRIHVWILYRYGYEEQPILQVCYKWINRLFNAAFPKGYVAFLTDSELLAENLGVVLRISPYRSLQILQI